MFLSHRCDGKDEIDLGENKKVLINRILAHYLLQNPIIGIMINKTDKRSLKRKGGMIMKSTGVVRKIDELGRIVIPKELRRTLDIQVKDPIEIFTSDNKIILQKYQADMACMITGEVLDENMSFGNGNIILSHEGMVLLQEELETKLGMKPKEMA